MKSLLKNLWILPAILLFLFSDFSTEAQVKGSHNYEIGVGINAYGILGAVGGPVRKSGPGAYFEYRYAFADHFDVGGQLSYRFSNGQTGYIGPETPDQTIKYNQIGLKTLADYNICPGRLANPYIGVGLGAGSLFEKRSLSGKSTSYFGVVGPRIGVQIWKFRIAIEADFAFDGKYGILSTETATALNLSFVF